MEEIVEALRYVDHVVIWESDTDDVSGALEELKPTIFANGGDRRTEQDIPEVMTCQKLNIDMVFHIGGGKINSSSELLRQYSGEK